MERVYSAFFHSDRRHNRKLTANALAQHDLNNLRRVLKQRNAININEKNEKLPNNSPLYSFTSSDDIFQIPEDLNMKNPKDPKINSNISDLNQINPLNISVDTKVSISIEKDLKAIMKYSIRAFIVAYGAKAFTALLLASRKWSSLEQGHGYADAVRLLLRRDTIRFGLFSGSIVAFFRITECIVRRQRSGVRDQWTLAIAGGVSGLALLLDSSTRRSTISIYIFLRMLDVVNRHLTSIGKVPTWKYTSEYLFGLSNAVIMYGFMFDPSLLPNGYYRWILQMGGVTHLGIQYVLRPEVATTFRHCQPHYHMESCVVAAAKGWFGGLGRAAQIYLPVHFLPALFFRSNRLKLEPIRATSKILFSALRSSAFLTSYQTIVKFVVCCIRNFFQKDHWFEACVSGMCTSASLFLEHPNRRFELMLYCIPRALGVLWELAERKHLVRYIKHSEVALFCCSMAIIMSSPPQYFKPTYLQVLRFIFGRNII